MSDPKPPCKYGNSCYRKNPVHFEQFHHPTQMSSTKQDISDTQSSPNKRVKLDPSFSPNKFGFYLTKVEGIDSKYNNNISSISLKDILTEHNDQLLRSAQFSFLIDLEWLIEQYPANCQQLPMQLVFGMKNEKDLEDMRNQSKKRSHVELCPVKINDPYGSHHTKMILLLYRNGIRVVILTANLIAEDWQHKTQGVWLSPIFPPLKANATNVKTCQTNFQKDLLQYLSCYRLASINQWCEIIRQHDMSTVNVFLVASVPGRHGDDDRSLYGHMKLRKTLYGPYGPSKRTVSTNWPAVCQFSSIGSLGATANKWLTGQFLSSLSTLSNEICLEKPDLKCIFPTVENVGNSLEGYLAGGSLCYSSQTAFRQTYLISHMHRWIANSTGRTQAMPHIKTYCRLAPDGSAVSWFLLTSANLSKAAWGELQVNGSKLFIRSFELGVLFLPTIFGIEKFPKEHLPLPYDTPLSAYTEHDQIWLWDLGPS